MIDTKGLYPVAIGCTGGSGSRALWGVLTASPQIFMDQDISPNAKDSQKSKTYLDLVNAPAETIRPLIEAFLITILEQIPAGSETRYKYFGWKSPRNILQLDALFQAHPELRFLHLIRDPAAMVNTSHPRKVYKREKASSDRSKLQNRAQYILTNWAEVNLPVWEKHKNDPGYLLVHYEALIQSPEQTIKSIYSWLQIDTAPFRDALSAIAPPEDAIDRGNNVDISSIAEAARKLGYGHRL